MVSLCVGSVSMFHPTILLMVIIRAVNEDACVEHVICSVHVYLHVCTCTFACVYFVHVYVARVCFRNVFLGGGGGEA